MFSSSKMSFSFLIFCDKNDRWEIWIFLLRGNVSDEDSSPETSQFWGKFVILPEAQAKSTAKATATATATVCSSACLPPVSSPQLKVEPFRPEMASMGGPNPPLGPAPPIGAVPSVQGGGPNGVPAPTAMFGSGIPKVGTGPNGINNGPGGPRRLVRLQWEEHPARVRRWQVVRRRRRSARRFTSMRLLGPCTAWTGPFVRTRGSGWRWAASWRSTTTKSRLFHWTKTLPNSAQSPLSTTPTRPPKSCGFRIPKVYFRISWRLPVITSGFGERVNLKPALNVF